MMAAARLDPEARESRSGGGRWSSPQIWTSYWSTTNGQEGQLQPHFQGLILQLKRQWFSCNVIASWITTTTSTESTDELKGCLSEKERQPESFFSCGSGDFVGTKLPAAVSESIH
jgi:hypothetical protein